MTKGMTAITSGRTITTYRFILSANALSVAGTYTVVSHRRPYRAGSGGISVQGEFLSSVCLVGGGMGPSEPGIACSA